MQIPPLKPPFRNFGNHFGFRKSDFWPFYFFWSFSNWNSHWSRRYPELSFPWIKKLNSYIFVIRKKKQPGNIKCFLRNPLRNFPIDIWTPPNVRTCWLMDTHAHINAHDKFPHLVRWQRNDPATVISRIPRAAINHPEKWYLGLSFLHNSVLGAQLKQLWPTGGCKIDRCMMVMMFE